MARLESNGDKLLLFCKFEEKELAKSVPGHKWNPEGKCWVYPIEYEVVNLLNKKFQKLKIGQSAINNLNKRKEQVEKLKRLKVIAKEQPKDPGLKLPLYQHQQILFTFGSALKYYADFSEPGTGKTAVQIGIISHLIWNEEIKKVLVVCPKSIMEAAWGNDIEKFAPWLNYIILTGGTEKIKQLLNEEVQIYIINYESTWRVLDSLLKKNFDMMICDESTRIKNHSSKQAKACIKIGDMVKYRSIMTGTPAPNTLLDIWSQFRFLDPEIFGKSFYQFRNKYFYPSGYGGYEWRLKAGSNDKIRERMYLRGMRFEKIDCLDLPPLTVQEIKIDLTGENRRQYNEMAKQMIIYLKESGEKIVAATILTKLLRLNMITSGFVQNTGMAPIDFEKQPKREALQELLDDIDGKHKIIIWAVFQHDIEKITEMLSGKALSLYGKTKNKQETINKFKNDSNIKYLIAHPRTAAHGLTLTEANYAIYYSIDYSFENYYQSIDRINRIGQKQKMTVYHLVCRDTIDESIYSALKRKNNLNKFISELKIKIKE